MSEAEQKLWADVYAAAVRSAPETERHKAHWLARYAEEVADSALREFRRLCERRRE